MNSQDTLAKSRICFIKRYCYLLLAFFVLFILFNTCEKDEGGTVITVVDSASEDITASWGGYITTESGVELYIPPSALSEDTRITVEELLVTSDMPWEYLAIVRISPSGLDLQWDATLTIPFEGDVDDYEEVELMYFYGEDPGYCIQTGEYAYATERYYKNTLSKDAQGNYRVQQQISSTGNTVVLRNCHGGTIKNINNMFMNRGCTRTNLIQQMNTTDTTLHLTDKTLEYATPKQVKAVLATYHDKKYSYWNGTDVPSDVIDKMEEHAKKGYSVVVMYGKTSGDQCSHTSAIVIKNGTAYIRNTCKVGNAIQKAYGNEIIYEHPLSDINNFRKSNPVDLLEKGLEGPNGAGCLADPSRNKTGRVVIPMEIRRNNQPWGSVNIYFEKAPSGSVPKSSEDPGNPCEYYEISKMWCAWRINNMFLTPVRVTTYEGFVRDELCSSYPGGGTDPNLLMEKVLLTGYCETKEEAINAACKLFNEVYQLSASSTWIFTTYIGKIGEQQYDIDELGGCGAK